MGTHLEVVVIPVSIQSVDRRADPLHRDTRLPERGQSVGLSKANERHRSLVAVCWPNRGNDWPATMTPSPALRRWYP